MVSRTYNSHKWCATVTVTGIFNCSLSRAFNTPILGDATEMLIAPGGFRLVKGFKNDETWGIEGGSRIPIGNGFLFVPPVEGGFDQIFEKDENRYWKWGVSKFPLPFFFVHENFGEWWVEEQGNGAVSVRWKYTWYSSNWITHPINWLFVKLFWSRVMKNGIERIKKMAEGEVPYVYNK